MNFNLKSQQFLFIHFAIQRDTMIFPRLSLSISHLQITAVFICVSIFVHVNTDLFAPRGYCLRSYWVLQPCGLCVWVPRAPTSLEGAQERLSPSLKREKTLMAAGLAQGPAPPRHCSWWAGQAVPPSASLSASSAQGQPATRTASQPKSVWCIHILK